MTFRRRLVLISVAALTVLVAVFLAVLPMIVRSVAVDRLTLLTGRTVTLADVDLNIFTGRAALTGLGLSQRGSAAPALELERLEVRLGLASLVTSNIRVVDVLVTAPRLHVTRLGPTQFDFDDLLALIPPADPARPPSTTTVTLERLALTRGTVVARDAAVAPAVTWRLEDLTVNAGDLSTRAGARPGRLTVRARINGTPLALEADSVDLARTAIEARLSLDALDLGQAASYVPPTVAVLPAGGRLTLALRAKTARADQGLQVTLGGDVRLDELAVQQRGAAAPLLRVNRLAVTIKEAAPLAGAVTLAAIEVDGMDLSAVRDKLGNIDLLSLAPPPAEPAPTPAPPVAAGMVARAALDRPLQIMVERLALTRARAALRDETVSPAHTLAVSDISVTATSVTWPGSAPLALEAGLTLPTAGRVTVKGTATLAPFSADLTTSMRGASIEPYHPYLPIKARLAGRFNGDSRTQVAITDGKLTAASKGTSWIEGLEVRNPADGTAPLKLARLELAGIDFAWPKYARVATITMRKPDIRVERDAAGALPLRALFEPRQSASTPAPAATAPSKPAPKSKPPVPADVKAAGGALGFPLDIGAFVIEDGYMQFIDRTVKPAFSETMSRVAVRVEGISSTPGKRAKLTTQAILGGDAALDIKGEVAPLGELYADITGELRDFTLTRVNPYADSFVAWIVDRGKLGVKFHIKVERGQLDAANEIFVQNIHVAPTRQDDEVKKRVGLPLGLIVALITDGNNDLKVNLPMAGPVESWRANLGDAIWTVVRNVVVNIVAAPFRAIGRLFKGSDDKIAELKVEPITFTAGAHAIAPPMDRHVTAVADFLRRAPAIRLALAAVAVPDDLESLRGQELTARLQARQREKALPDFRAAITAEYKERFPGVPVPSPDEQLAKLREGQTVPPERVTELLVRRLAAVREGLVKGEGIPEARLRDAETADAPPSGEGEGRVEFRIGQ
jgi:uncharacterized protein involved in outer membrane biogenesis